MRKRILAWMAVSVLGLSLLGGCGSSEQWDESAFEEDMEPLDEEELAQLEGKVIEATDSDATASDGKASDSDASSGNAEEDSMTEVTEEGLTPDAGGNASDAVLTEDVEDPDAQDTDLEETEDVSADEEASSEEEYLDEEYLDEEDLDSISLEDFEAALEAAEALVGNDSQETEDIDPEDLDENGSYTSKDEVAAYIYTFGHLPDNYITEAEARALGWNGTDNLDEVAEGMSIGGDTYDNANRMLPVEDGLTYWQCDVNYEGGERGTERIFYASDGRIYYSADEGDTFEQLY
ncbi:MAG: hypothetical protein LUF78_05040 [Clostridiales bacterium]|nr:hypothetical protein [Clostridiales bacterium]